MRDRNWSGVIPRLIILVAGLAVNFQSLSQEDNRPNIIWLMAEDISLDLGCYGMKGAVTPTLDALAANGLRFDNCYVTNPICSPSRSSMMLGTHQQKSNTYQHRSNRETVLSDPYKPFTYWLRKAGYTTILGHEAVRSSGGKTDVNFKHQATGEWDGVEQFGLFDKRNSYELEDMPFFAQITLITSHRGGWWNQVRATSKNPVDPETVELPPYLADHPTVRLDWAKYLDQIAYMDNEVKLVLDDLEKRGLADNTVVIFIGDNGRCNIKGKGYLYEPGLKVPLIVHWPEKLKPAVNTDVVSSTDITATILELAGVEVPEYMTGSSFLAEDFSRKEVYATRDLWDEVQEQSRAITNGEWKYIRNDKPEVPWDAGQAYLEFYRPAVHIMRRLKTEGSLNENELAFFADSKPREELYNLTEDPYELNNLASKKESEKVLMGFRNQIKEYEVEMKPVSNEMNVIYPKAVDVLKWVKEKKPELHKKMLNGIEIGFGQQMKKKAQQDKN